MSSHACHFRLRRGPLHEPEEVRSGQSTQQRAVSTRKDSSQVVGLERRRSMADAIDAAVNGQEETRPAPPTYLRRSDAGRKHGAMCDQAVGAGGHPGEDCFRCVRLMSHCDIKSPQLHN
jgi:hypothetical protein